MSKIVIHTTLINNENAPFLEIGLMDPTFYYKASQKF